MLKNKHRYFISYAYTKKDENADNSGFGCSIVERKRKIEKVLEKEHGLSEFADFLKKQGGYDSLVILAFYEL